MRDKFLSLMTLSLMFYAGVTHADSEANVWTLTTEKPFKERDYLSCLLTFPIGQDAFVVKMTRDADGKPYTRIYIQHVQTYLQSFGISDDPWSQLGDNENFIFNMRELPLPFFTRRYESNGVLKYYVEAKPTDEFPSSTDAMFKQASEDSKKTDLLSNGMIEGLTEVDSMVVESQTVPAISLRIDLASYKRALPQLMKCASANAKL